ncbi:TrbC/VirB2 family protein [Erythrobacter ani]|uniref:TrbC/VirB2 family protein n=1 Tax=Erythrobacter ani TaxID=2827235 RepID=A0ABS6SJF4_9SPHN|nr:TrbC/VirB2 family protein [Erythrobacter ani]MBV7265136.1 TrbC/VirB2 family protein [Erythrobacter ani]
MTSLESALGWIVGVVTGPLVTAFLTLGIAFAAFRMLNGEISFKRAGLVVAGSFLLIASGEIAQSFMEFVPRGEAALPAPAQAIEHSPLPERNVETNQNSNPFDPYSGT